MIKKAKLLPLTYYELMGLDRGCSTHDVNNQYERLKRIYYSENPMLRDLFDDEGLFIFNNLLDSIYNHLSDLELRKEYDMEVENSITSLEESFPEDFNVTEVLRKYNKVKKEPSRLIKKDVFGRDAEKKAAVQNNPDTVDTNILFEKLSDEMISGEHLKKIREEAGLSLKALTASTKISSFIITSIENNDFYCLPAEIYVRGFLKNYCKVLRLSKDNTDKTIRDYMKLMLSVISPPDDTDDTEEGQLSEKIEKE